VVLAVGVGVHSQTHELARPFHKQVSKVYPTSTEGFAPELMALLEAQGGRLDPPLRRAMVSSLILLRNRNQASQEDDGGACVS
jgi:hypothetical protein